MAHRGPEKAEALTNGRLSSLVILNRRSSSAVWNRDSCRGAGREA